MQKSHPLYEDHTPIPLLFNSSKLFYVFLKRQTLCRQTVIKYLRNEWNQESKFRWPNLHLFRHNLSADPNLKFEMVALTTLTSDDALDQDQDQDSLLVKRRNDNHSPGPVIRELVPSSHQRSELSNKILCIFSRWDQRIGESIPIPDSLGKEATFINICISNGSLKCHRVLISTTPSGGDMVICWYTDFTLKP